MLNTVEGARPRIIRAVEDYKTVSRLSLVGTGASVLEIGKSALTENHLSLDKAVAVVAFGIFCFLTSSVSEYLGYEERQRNKPPLKK